MSTLIDRRQNPSDKSLGSRQKFIKRAKEQVKRAIDASVTGTSIKDFGKGTVTVPIKGISEPTFSNNTKTGKRRQVIPGNKDYSEGDLLPKPPESGGHGNGEASEDGQGEDDFSFILTKEEFNEFFFDEMELPNLIEKQLIDAQKTKPKRSGYVSNGNPSNLSISRTVKKSLGRRVALKRPKQSEVDELQAAILEASTEEERSELAAKLELLFARMRAIPYVDKVDLRYRNTVQEPSPNSRACMICLMDVSGSMQEREKLIAKKFYILLYLFLHKEYEKVEIVFVRHHSTAEECSEDDFFYKQESGGTIVSSGLFLVNEICNRYPKDQWNLYVAQSSDGDNYVADNKNCTDILSALLPRLQYFTYLDIPNAYAGIGAPSSLWELYEGISEQNSNVGMALAHDESGAWQAMKKLFAKGTSL